MFWAPLGGGLSRAEVGCASRHRFGAVARHAPARLARLPLELTVHVEHGGCCSFAAASIIENEGNQCLGAAAREPSGLSQSLLALRSSHAVSGARFRQCGERRPTRIMLAVAQRACCRKACPAQQIACGGELASCGHVWQLRSMFTDVMQCTAVLGCVSGRAHCAATRVCPVLREQVVTRVRRAGRRPCRPPESAGSRWDCF
jgi:hypothetical protein